MPTHLGFELKSADLDCTLLAMRSWRIRTKFRLLVTVYCGLCCAATLSVAAALSLEEGFQKPPAEARPWVYWFWNNGNVTSNGVTADLEAMQRVGIGGALIMDVVERFAPPAGTADYMNPEWQGLVLWSLQEADRLGLEVNLANGPGWTGSSGQWITPKMSMQKLVWTNVVVIGPTSFCAVLQTPYTGDKVKQGADVHNDAGAKYEDFYADAAVLAFPANETVDAVPREAVVNLTSKLGKEGQLRWQVPAGKWTVQRIGYTTTGKSTRPPVAGGSGLECDKLSRDAMDLQFGGMLGRVIAAAGPLAGRSLTATHIDSWEAGPQVWTPALSREFRQRRGYDLTPFLPVLLGIGTNAVTVGSPQITERFRWDYQQTLSELLAENYVGRLATLAHKHGLRLSIEGYNLKTFGDEATYTARADEPMGEFWTPSEWGAEETRRKSAQMASVAHTTGKKIVGAEAFTSGIAERWLFHPALIKGLGDEQFCRGVNRFVFHRYAHQPYLDRVPGATMGPWGLHYERTQTWWEFSGGWHEYLARCQFMLRQGLFVADLCYLRPEQPHQTYFSPVPAPPDGYRYDEISVEALLTRARVRNGRITLPDGMSYRVLVVPPVGTMTPALARKLMQLVANGATVVVNGPAPEQSPGLTGFPRCDREVAQLTHRIWEFCDRTPTDTRKGRVSRDKPLSDLLAEMDTPPDFESDTRLNWIHRREKDLEFYFVANRWAARCETVCRFRVGDRNPELWDPATGTMTRLATYEKIGRIISMPLHLEPSGSVFVVFRKPTGTVDPVVSFTRNKQTLFTSTPQVKVEVQKAVYGPPSNPGRMLDVRTKLRAVIGDGFTPFRVSEMGGDGPGRVPWKELRVDYTVDGQSATISGKDPEVISLASPRSAPEPIASLRLDAKNQMVIEASERGNYEVSTASGRTLQAVINAIPEPLEIKGPWRLEFAPGRSAPKTIDVASLVSWSDSGDAELSYHSGTANYSTAFEWNEPPVAANTRKIVLDLGDVQVMARVKLNGRDLGVLWRQPYRLEVTHALFPGRNTLEVSVANLWPNRMIGDANLPESQRVTWSSWQPFTNGTPLLASGLLGPVKLLSAERRTLESRGDLSGLP